VSGPPATQAMSTLSFKNRSDVTWAARLESDWVSLVNQVTLCFFPSPMTIESPMYFCTSPIAHLSLTPKRAR
jgi:hypothetical protein